jgi:hypothetical protein
VRTFLKASEVAQLEVGRAHCADDGRC